MSLEGVKFVNYPLPNGKLAIRARRSEKNCSFQTWEDVKDTLGPRDVVVRAIPGPVLTRTSGKVAKCTNGYPLLETATCCWKASNKSLHPAWKVDQHDQVGYLTAFLRHVRTSTCTACRYPNCFAPPGHTTYLQIGENGPVCKLHLVSQLSCCYNALFLFYGVRLVC